MRALIVGAVLCMVSSGQQRTVSDAEVMRVHRSALLIDTHNDVPWRVLDGKFDIGPRTDSWHTDLPRMKEGGIGAQFFSVYVAGEYEQGNRSAQRALEMIDAVRTGIVSRYPNDFVLATSVHDIEEAHKRGKIAALMGL